MKIEFVSYDGAYPNLCSGTLTLLIDDKEYKFGWLAENEQFWVSGGSVSFNDEWEEKISKRKWKVKKSALPDFLKPHAQELIDLFNKHVPKGCCGGCV